MVDWLLLDSYLMVDLWLTYGWFIVDQWRVDIYDHSMLGWWFVIYNELWLMDSEYQGVIVDSHAFYSGCW